ncbi:MAG: type II toxin-antitoxin system VapC family toxin [Chitinophagaceae bacterium]
MNGIDYLADTNILLYILEDLPQTQELSKHFFAVSVITEIELLGKKDITTQEANIIKKILQDCVLLPFTDEVKEKAIELKQKYAIKIPDSIIAATAILHNLTIATADKGFQKIAGLKSFILEF